jgi:hypothetical protein
VGRRISLVFLGSRDVLFAGTQRVALSGLDPSTWRVGELCDHGRRYVEGLSKIKAGMGEFGQEGKEDQRRGPASRDPTMRNATAYGETLRPNQSLLAP